MPIFGQENREDFVRRAQAANAHTPREQIRGLGERGTSLGDYGYGSYRDRSQQMDGDLGRLRDIAEGRVSHSAEALRQGLMQNMAQQQSMAAGARGGNQVMAARNASMNAGRAGSGLAGQQALAGIRERQAAANALLGAQGQMRGQDLQAGLGGYGLGMQSQLGLLQNPKQSDFDKYLGMGLGVMQAF